MTLTITNRELRLEVAHNVRHMGGYTTKDGRTTTDVVVRSAGLHRLTEAGVGHLADHGIAAIVDLRSTVERERDVTPSLSHTSIRHITSAVFEQDQSPVGQAPEFPGYFVVYQRMLETGREAYRTLFEVIAETDGRVLFHCTAGKDRTGVAAALMLGLAGVDAETITEDFSHSYRLLEPVLQDWLPKMAERGIDDRHHLHDALRGRPPGIVSPGRRGPDTRFRHRVLRPGRLGRARRRSRRGANRAPRRPGGRSRVRNSSDRGGRLMALHEIDPLLERIRTLVAEAQQLEGDGADEGSVAARQHEVAQLKSVLAKVVSHDPAHDYGAAA